MIKRKNLPAGTEANCNSLTRRYSGALLLVAAASLLIACGGAESDSGGSTTPTISNTVTLAWDAVPSADISGYRVYYGTTPGKYFQPLGQGLNAGNVTTSTVTGFPSATTYYFATTAYDALNNESGYSNEVSRTFP